MHVSLEILGCGTSTGVPIMTCTCKVCRSRHPRNHRLRASVWFQVRARKGAKAFKSFLVDASIDHRQQALRSNIQHVDATLMTHPHADHMGGIDELRPYSFVSRQAIPVYGNDWTCTELRKRYSYLFDSDPHGHSSPASDITRDRQRLSLPINPNKKKGGGIAQIDLRRFDARVPQLEVCGIPVIPISTQHGPVAGEESVGYRIDSVAYVTDCSYISPSSLERLQGLSTLVLDCVRIAPHDTHFNLSQALDTIAQLKPKRAFLTHLGHDFDYVEFMRGKKLPPGVALAYDGLVITNK